MARNNVKVWTDEEAIEIADRTVTDYGWNHKYVEDSLDGPLTAAEYRYFRALDRGFILSAKLKADAAEVAS